MNDYITYTSYDQRMPKKAPAPQVIGPDWYLRDWLDALGVNQAELGRRTGWSKATVSDIYHGRTNYYREIVNQIASALHLHAWELLMPPEEAHRIKRWRAAFEAEQVKLATERAPDAPIELSKTVRSLKRTG